ncbi:cytochrome P450 [Xylariaceae sp. FL0594]|nr:cytochrome P450 [Xylariaceae sp. FL0594]
MLEDLNTTVVVVAAVLTLCSIVISYQYLHDPLASYPGPLLARFSDGYGAYHALRKQLHVATLKDHLKYGSVVRHGPNKLVFNTLTALRDIYHNERVTKARLYEAVQESPGVHNIFNEVDREKHRLKRKLVSPVVTERSMRLFEPTMTAQADIFLKSLLAAAGGPVDLKERVQWLMFDIISFLSFGYAMNLQTSAANRFLPRAIYRDMFRFNVTMQLAWLPRFYLQFPLNLLFLPLRWGFVSLLLKMIRLRSVRDKDDSRDFYSFVTSDSEDPTRAIQPNDMWSEAIFFFIAGGDTTSTAISATLYYLSKNQECYRKLADEIRSTFQEAEEIKGPTLAGCNYLRACIYESMRLSPPAPGTLWRQLAPEEERNGPPLVVDGVVVPAGTAVGINVYALHHNERYFPNPFKFDPERWMPGPAASVSYGGDTAHQTTMCETFIPFALGSRSCAGKAMAYLETSMVIAKTLWYFDFETAPGKLGETGTRVMKLPGYDESVEEFEMFDALTATHNGPYLVFEPREPECRKLDVAAPRVSK